MSHITLPGRIIPAYAGSTPSGRKRSPSSSWIIPAYAGSTRRRCRWPPAGRDHPRIRGEHSIWGSANVDCVGSSPHTRGAPLVDGVDQVLTGIIPAYAGSTGTLRLLYIQSRDHPRIRGEHVSALLSAVEDAGSSPHTRGAPLNLFRALAVCRIIPAYAGSTSTRSRSGSGNGDHPRIRGEHAVFVEGHLHVPGSSPHTRGARRRRRVKSAAMRIIPAYAGSTPPLS